MSDNPARTRRIISKHVHDVRNSLNCLDLLAVMVDDPVADPAKAGLIAMMRAELTQLEATVNSLQFKFAEPQPSVVTADDLMLMWKNQLASLENATHQIAWSPPVAPGTLTVDVNAIVSVLRDLIIAMWNLGAGGMLKAAVSTMGTSTLAEVRDPHPHKPLGADDMEEARRIIEINGGTLDVSEDTISGERVVTLRFNGPQTT